MDRKRDGYDGNISIERKLALVRKIRQEHQMNQNAVKGREAYLYGNRYQGQYDMSEEGRAEEMSKSEASFSTLKFRITAAAFLFGIFYTALIQNKSFMGVSISQIYQSVETDYSANLFDFMNQIPYTLHE